MRPRYNAPSRRPSGQSRSSRWHGLRRASDEFSFDLPPAALEGALEILPCLSVVHDGAWGYQFAIECETKAGHSSPGRPRPNRLVCRGRGGRGKRSGRCGNRPLAHPHPLCKRPPYTCASKASPPRPRPCSRSRCAAKAQCPLRPSPTEIRLSSCRRKARWFCGPSWLPTSARRPASPCSSRTTAIARTSTT